MPSKLRSFLRARQASAAIEFALVLPVLLLFMAGIVEAGRAFLVYRAANELATRYAIAWADCSDSPNGTCATELTNYTSANTIKNIVPQLTNTVGLRMIEVKMGTSPTVVYASPSGATLTSAELTAAQGVIPSGQFGVVVSVSYTHTLVFFAQLMSPFLGSSRSISYTVAQLKS